MAHQQASSHVCLVLLLGCAFVWPTGASDILGHGRGLCLLQEYVQAVRPHKAGSAITAADVRKQLGELIATQKEIRDAAASNSLVNSRVQALKSSIKNLWTSLDRLGLEASRDNPEAVKLQASAVKAEQKMAANLQKAVEQRLEALKLLGWVSAERDFEDLETNDSKLELSLVSRNEARFALEYAALAGGKEKAKHPEELPLSAFVALHKRTASQHELSRRVLGAMSQTQETLIEVEVAGIALAKNLADAVHLLEKSGDEEKHKPKIEKKDRQVASEPMVSAATKTHKSSPESEKVLQSSPPSVLVDKGEKKDRYLSAQDLQFMLKAERSTKQVASEPMPSAATKTQESSPESKKADKGEKKDEYLSAQDLQSMLKAEKATKQKHTKKKKHMVADAVEPIAHKGKKEDKKVIVELSDALSSRSGSLEELHSHSNQKSEGGSYFEVDEPRETRIETQSLPVQYVSNKQHEQPLKDEAREAAGTVSNASERPINLLANDMVDKIEKGSRVASVDITENQYPRMLETKTAYELALGPSPQFCSDGIIWEGFAGHPAECQVKCDLDVQCNFFAYFHSKSCIISKSCDSQAKSGNDEALVFKKKEARDSYSTEAWWSSWADAQRQNRAQPAASADRSEIQLSTNKDTMNRVASDADDEGEVLKRESPFDGGIVLQAPSSSRFTDGVQDFLNTDLQQYLLRKGVHEKALSSLEKSLDLENDKPDVVDPSDPSDPIMLAGNTSAAEDTKQKIRRTDKSDTRFLHKVNGTIAQKAESQVSTSANVSSLSKIRSDKRKTNRSDTLPIHAGETDEDIRAFMDLMAQANQALASATSSNASEDSTKRGKLRHQGIGKHRRHAESNRREQVMEKAAPTVHSRRQRRMRYFVFLFVPLLLGGLVAIALVRQPGFSIQTILNKRGIFGAERKPASAKQQTCKHSQGINASATPRQHRSNCKSDATTGKEYHRTYTKDPDMFVIHEAENESDADNDCKGLRTPRLDDYEALDARVSFQARSR